MQPRGRADEVGAVIANRYRVEQLLGRGGMAVVYRVLDQRSGSAIALKRCAARDSRNQARYEALLEREYHTLAQLAHPRIIAVHDYGVDGRGPYYTMELLEGVDLGRVERMPWKEACALLCDVASSLAILHSRGLVHRDVSLRNVRYGADGRAKLLDFGAMTSQGVAKDAVGTPPFMAPEVLQLQALDGRADLFSLGALGYRLLTGRQAYPAKQLSQLRDVWRSKPQPPTLSAPEVPAELSALLLRMLSLDRASRPQHAAEVIERLRTLAGLQLGDGAEVSRAYLTTPTLVGREAALLAVRRRMLSLVRGDGGVILVKGEAGSGRSRVLDACALEAKLIGATVVRADTRDSEAGPWGVVQALAAELIELFPSQAAEAARLSRNILSYINEELRGEAFQTSAGDPPERSVLIRELREWVLSLSKGHRLVIVVDDVDRIDDPSAAVLSALAHKADRKGLLLALAVETNDILVASAALRVLHDVADPIELEWIRPEQTEDLIRELFGDVQNLPACAARIHGLSHGNPRAVLELAQHLVDTGQAHYEAGSWSLPAQLDENDLPLSLMASLSERLAGLSENARELAAVLAIADGDRPQASTYASLTEHQDPKRVFEALDELVAARILSAGMERYSFTQRGFLAVLQEWLSDERRRQIHLRIAQLTAHHGGDELRRVHHLLAAGHDAEAIELLCSVDLHSRLPSVGLLSSAIERGERLGLDASTLHRLRMALLIHAPFVVASHSFRRVVPIVLSQLERDSGLARYRELEQLPESARMSQALALTHQAYLATPERERVHSAFVAIRELAQVSSALSSLAVVSFDLELLESLPSIAPLLPLSPTLLVVQRLVDAARFWLQGRLPDASATYNEISKRIAEADRAGLDSAQHERVRFGIEYALGLLEALGGSQAAETRAQFLEGHRKVRVNAWRVRSLLQLALGNTEGWRRCARRAELLQAQEGLEERYSRSSAGMELALHWRLGDLLAVKALRTELSNLAGRHPGWRSVELLGRAAYCELQGDLDGALEAIERALEIAVPLRAPFFGTIAANHVNILSQLGRWNEAAERGRAYVPFCEQRGLNGLDLYRYVALALSRAGQYEEALVILASAIETHRRLGNSGFALGVLYETGAHIALARVDRASFEAFAERCSREYQHSKNPSVVARLDQLFELAREQGVRPSDEIVELRRSIQPLATEGEEETVHSRIAECVDGADRGRCGLTLLLQSTPRSVGFLYVLKPDQAPSLSAAVPDPPSDPSIERWLESMVQNWLEFDARDEPETDSAASDPVSSSGETAAFETETGGSAANPYRFQDAEGRWLQAIALADDQATRRSLAGVLVVHVGVNEVISVPRTLCSSIARELIEYGDSVARSPDH